MAKGKDFENILNECLDRLIGGETVESCLARHPEYAAELEPLLKTVLEARIAASVKPRSEFRQQAGIEFQKAISKMPSKAVRRTFKWQLRWVIPVAVFLVLFSGGAGTVMAATNSLPDSPLYGIKLAAEQVQLAFTPSAQGKAELYAKFVNNRVEEIDKMAEKGKLDQVERVTERMNNQLLAMADLQFNGREKGAAALSGIDSQASAPTLAAPTITSAPATVPPSVTVTHAPESYGSPGKSNDNADKSDKKKLKDRLVKEAEHNLQILRERLEKAPEALKPALQKAIEIAEQGYAQAIVNLG